MRKLGTDCVADRLDDFIFMKEVDFTFRGVHVDVHTLRFNIQTQIDERVAAFREKWGVGLLDRFLDC